MFDLIARQQSLEFEHLEFLRVMFKIRRKNAEKNIRAILTISMEIGGLFFLIMCGEVI